MDLRYFGCNNIVANNRSKFSNNPKGICCGNVIGGTSLKHNLTSRIQRVQESSKILENVLDISTTLVKILTSCGIHECKANKALDVIIYAFMHFDEVVENPGGRSRKRIRKDEFLSDLMKDCDMTEFESKLTYSVVKCAFRAFYHKQIVNKFDASFVDEREWNNAANKTINAFAASGATQSEVEIIGRRVVVAYQNYISRMQAKKNPSLSQWKTVRGGECMCGKTNIRINPPNQPPSTETALSGQLCCEIVSPPDSYCPEVVCKDRCGRVFLRVVGNRIAFDPYMMECEAKRAIEAACQKVFSDSKRPNICGDGSFNKLTKLAEDGEDFGRIARKLLGDESDQVLANICKNVEDVCNRESEVGPDSPEQLKWEDKLDQNAVIEETMELEKVSEQKSAIEPKLEFDDVSKQKPKREVEDESEIEPKLELKKESEQEPVRESNMNLENELEIDLENDMINEEEEVAIMFEENQAEEEEQVDEKFNAERSAAGGLKANDRSGSPDMLMAVKFIPTTDGGQRMEVDLQGYSSEPPKDILELRICFNQQSTLDFVCKQITK